MLMQFHYGYKTAIWYVSPSGADAEYFVSLKFTSTFDNCEVGEKWTKAIHLMVAFTTVQRAIVKHHIDYSNII